MKQTGHQHLNKNSSSGGKKQFSNLLGELSSIAVEAEPEFHDTPGMGKPVNFVNIVQACS